MTSSPSSLQLAFLQPDPAVISATFISSNQRGGNEGINYPPQSSLLWLTPFSFLPSTTIVAQPRGPGREGNNRGRPSKADERSLMNDSARAGCDRTEVKRPPRDFDVIDTQLRRQDYLREKSNWWLFLPELRLIPEMSNDLLRVQLLLIANNRLGCHRCEYDRIDSIMSVRG